MSKNNKRGDPNKWGGWNFFQNLINGEVLIRAGRVNFSKKINKRASPFIRQVRVLLRKRTISVLKNDMEMSSK